MRAFRFYTITAVLASASGILVHYISEDARSEDRPGVSSGPASVPATGTAVPDSVLAGDIKRPMIACTPEELARLRTAWKGSGPEHNVVVNMINRAEKGIARPPEFPPRGGQHNQWYQCEACQIGLKTIDDAHHECPKCKKVYTGKPYDDVIFSLRHRDILRSMTDTAWAYAITGKKEYADYAVKILLGYAERYKNYPYHTNDIRISIGTSGGHLFEQTLNEAECMARQVGPAFDLVCDSESLSDADRRTIRDGLIRPMLENIGKHRAGKSNWQSWHNAAMIWGGAALGEIEWIRRAVDDPRNGFNFQMKASVTSDGMWYENSWGYHFYTLQALTAAAEGARRLGIDLWKNPALISMFTLPASYTMADGSLPRFGDDVNSSATDAANLFECAYQACKSPDIAKLLQDKVSWETVLFGRSVGSPGERVKATGSAAFASAGHVILRTGGEAGMSAALTFGPYGGFHGHFDKLSFVFFAFGKELGVDPGRAASQAYRLPIHRDWYKATVSHNAVLVDGASQQPAEGKLRLFGANENCAAALAACDSAYKNVRHQRLLCMMPEYLLVVDELKADKPCSFDWLYHNRGKEVRTVAVEKEGTFGEKFAGQEYINNILAGSTNQPVDVTFDAGEISVRLIMSAESDTEVRTGNGVGASVTDRVPMVDFRRHGQQARFVAIFEPFKNGAKPQVGTVTAEETRNGLCITVRKGDRTDSVTLTADGNLNVVSGGKTVLTVSPASAVKKADSSTRLSE